jgi:pilus assembly protein Flp/PilA
MGNFVSRFWNDESGQGLTEYGMLLAAVVVVLIAVIVAFRDNLQDIFTELNADLDTLDGQLE